MSLIMIRSRWVIVVLISVASLFFGTMMLMGKMSQQFTDWGYPGGFVYLIGVFHVLASIGLYRRKTERISTLVLAIISAGAVLTHVGHHEGVISFLPSFTLLISVFILMYLNAKRRADFLAI